jgi:hypothetical protein
MIKKHPENLEPMRGIEPLTPSLPWKCSTPELHWRRKASAMALIFERATRLEPATLSLEG